MAHNDIMSLCILKYMLEFDLVWIYTYSIEVPEFDWWLSRESMQAMQ